MKIGDFLALSFNEFNDSPPKKKPVVNSLHIRKRKQKKISVFEDTDDFNTYKSYSLESN